ncbi:MAG: F0F1 ATP synthase subunit epsilon [Clostridia bacterium]|nr:F0F1 ATP synthase subunit epsilon [Clostridia bacterium]
MKSFHFAILTPRECVYEGEILSLVLPTEDGQIGFLSCREETVIQVMAGDFRVTDEAGGTHLFETDGGVFRITREGANLLCGAAYHKEEAADKRREDAERLEADRQRQEKSLADYKMTRLALMRAFEKIKRSNQGD